MNNTVEEVLQFVRENDVKFIRLSFCDVFGAQKNISIMPNELERAFEHGITIDAAAVQGFLNLEESDLFLIPDAGTLSFLPWRPAQGRVVRFFCDIRRPDGVPFEGDGRAILKAAVQECAEKGYVCKIGAECEFYLFLTDEAGTPTDTPFDHGSYCDIAPADKGENVRREICLTLEQMGIQPESSHHEEGPGQNEVDFRYSDALTAADNLVTFKSVVKVIAERNGLYASFLPKPFADRSGSGLHVNISLSKDGRNIFRVGTDEHCPQAESFIAGVLNRTRECTAFFNPLTNSYSRFGSFEVPRYISWSRQNRSQLIRIPAAPAQRGRMELRSPDPSCNPYLAFALLIRAGLEGIEQSLPLSEPTHAKLNDYHSADPDGLPQLPANLGEAIESAKHSTFIKRSLPERLTERYFRAKELEWKQVSSAKNRTAVERELYFLNL